MAEVKGMLMQKSGKKGVVMTATGEFINVKLPAESVQLGEEIIASVWQQRRPFKYLFAAAAVILMVLLIPGYQLFYTNQAMAYVALDINPSIELAVGKDMEILEARGLNSDGKKIVSEVTVTGEQLYQALPLLVEQAITDGYLNLGRDNVVLSTVTIADKSNAVKIEETQLQQAINKPIQDKHIEARIVIEQSGSVDRNAAQKAGLSTGKYMIYKEAKKQGINLTVDELRSQGIYQFEQQKKVKVEQILHKQLTPNSIEATKQQVYSIIEQQLPPKQSAELKQTINKVIQQQKTNQQQIKPEQIEQLLKQLQYLQNEQQKVQKQLNPNRLTPEQVEAVRNQIQDILRQQTPSSQMQKREQQAIEQKQPWTPKEKHKELDIKGNPGQWVLPGQEKKHEPKQYPQQPLPPKFEKLRQEMEKHNKHE